MQKDVYPYEYIHDWDNETSLTEKEDYYSNLNMDDITDADSAHGKRVCKDFKIKNLGEYHNLYVQSITLLLTDYLKTFNICVWKYMKLRLLNFLLHQD